MVKINYNKKLRKENEQKALKVLEQFSKQKESEIKKLIEEAENNQAEFDRGEIRLWSDNVIVVVNSKKVRRELSDFEKQAKLDEFVISDFTVTPFLVSNLKNNGEYNKLMNLKTGEKLSLCEIPELKNSGMFLKRTDLFYDEDEEIYEDRDYVEELVSLCDENQKVTRKKEKGTFDIFDISVDRTYSLYEFIKMTKNQLDESFDDYIADALEYDRDGRNKARDIWYPVIGDPFSSRGLLPKEIVEACKASEKAIAKSLKEEQEEKDSRKIEEYCKQQQKIEIETKPYINF